MSGTLFIEMVVGLAIFAIIFMALQEGATIMLDFGFNVTNDSDSRETMTFMESVWRWLPAIVAIGMLFYIIARSQKRDETFVGGI